MFDFPDVPTANQTISTPEGVQYIWTGSKWTLVVTPVVDYLTQAEGDGLYANITGDTFTGPVGIGHAPRPTITLDVNGYIAAANYQIMAMGTADAGTVGFTNGQGPGIVFYGIGTTEAGRLDLTDAGIVRVSVNDSVTVYGTLAVTDSDMGIYQNDPLKDTALILGHTMGAWRLGIANNQAADGGYLYLYDINSNVTRMTVRPAGSMTLTGSATGAIIELIQPNAGSDTALLLSHPVNNWRIGLGNNASPEPGDLYIGDVTGSANRLTIKKGAGIGGGAPMQITANGSLYTLPLVAPTTMQPGTVAANHLAVQQLMGFNCYFDGAGAWHHFPTRGGFAFHINADPTGGIFSVGITDAANQGVASGPTGVFASRLVVQHDGTCLNSSGTWVAISDAGTKTNVAAYQTGLDALLALQPVSFEYGPASPYGAEGITRYGLVADEVEPSVPAAVGSYDYEGTSLKTVDPGHMIFVLINSMKEVAARLDALEAASGVARAAAPQPPTRPAQRPAPPPQRPAPRRR